LNAKSVENESELIPGFIAPSLPARGDAERLKKLANGLKLEISEPVNFWTEAALFSEAGHDAIVFGPGDIKNAHQPNEFVMLKDLSIALEIYKEIIQ
jgi:acetylornithine deacetylase